MLSWAWTLSNGDWVFYIDLAIRPNFDLCFDLFGNMNRFCEAGQLWMSSNELYIRLKCCKMCGILRFNLETQSMKRNRCGSDIFLIFIILMRKWRADMISDDTYAPFAALVQATMNRGVPGSWCVLLRILGISWRIFVFQMHVQRRLCF